eukprot:GFUD01007994.1.p2 GENE.GFUD01007994.1~~GFUD01007994.1.p2  ORF type:complete len:132 (+),score=9.73 GFUD01007994.1:79-474(+)
MNRIIIALTCLLAPALGAEPYNLDEMATSACVGIAPAGYHTVVAVRRQCSRVTVDCKKICAQAKPFAANAGFTCFDSLQVYKDRPILGERIGGALEPSPPPDAGEYGPIIHKYGDCGGSCGPNYCCCRGHK